MSLSQQFAQEMDVISSQSQMFLHQQPNKFQQQQPPKFHYQQPPMLHNQQAQEVYYHTNEVLLDKVNQLIQRVKVNDLQQHKQGEQLHKFHQDIANLSKYQEDQKWQYDKLRDSISTQDRSIAALDDKFSNQIEEINIEEIYAQIRNMANKSDTEDYLRKFEKDLVEVHRQADSNYHEVEKLKKKIKCDDNEKLLKQFRRRIADLEHKFANYSDMPYIEEINVKIRNMASKSKIDMEIFKKALAEINHKTKTIYSEVKDIKKKIKATAGNERYIEELLMYKSTVQMQEQHILSHGIQLEELNILLNQNNNRNNEDRKLRKIQATIIHLEQYAKELYRQLKTLREKIYQHNEILIEMRRKWNLDAEVQHKLLIEEDRLFPMQEDNYVVIPQQRHRIQYPPRSQSILPRRSTGFLRNYPMPPPPQMMQTQLAKSVIIPMPNMKNLKKYVK